MNANEASITYNTKHLDDGRIATWHSVGNVIYLSFYVDPLELLWR